MRLRRHITQIPAAAAAAALHLSAAAVWARHVDITSTHPVGRGGRLSLEGSTDRPATARERGHCVLLHAVTATG